MCQRCLSGCFYKDLQFQPTYKPKNMTAAVKKKRCSGMLWGFFAAGQIGAAQNSQKRGHFETPSQEISNPSPGHRWRPQAFFHNGGKIVWDNIVKVSDWLSQNPDLEPKEELKACVGAGRPALHQLCQEGWVTLFGKLEKSCLTQVWQIKDFQKWTTWM